jgi:hypothetical protein
MKPSTGSFTKVLMVAIPSWKSATQEYVQYRIHFYSYFWDLNPKKKERQDKTPKIIGYSMWIPYSMMFTCLCFLWRVHATCSVVKMDVWSDGRMA